MERKLKDLAVSTSEITPESLYLSRRDFLRAAGIVSATASWPHAGYLQTDSPPHPLRQA